MLISVCYKIPTLVTRRKKSGEISGELGQIYFSHGTSSTRGVCILFKDKDKYGVSRIERDEAGRALYGQIKIGECSFAICNIHASNEDNTGFFLNVFNMLDNIDTPYRIIGGNLNLALDMRVDKKGVIYNNFRATEMVTSFVSR